MVTSNRRPKPKPPTPRTAGRTAGGGLALPNPDQWLAEDAAAPCRHGVTQAQVAEYAAQAAERFGTHVGTCQCCGGPSPKRRVATPEGQPLQWVEFPYCGLCAEGMTYAEQVARYGLTAPFGFDHWLTGQAERSRVRTEGGE